VEKGGGPLSITYWALLRLLQILRLHELLQLLPQKLKQDPAQRKPQEWIALVDVIPAVVGLMVRRVQTRTR
jgi:hypothetical protein